MTAYQELVTVAESKLGKLVFVQCPMLPMDRFHYSKNIRKWYTKKGVVLPPLGMAYLASIMRNKGYPLNIIDGYAEDLSREEMLSKIKKEEPDYLLFSSSTSTFLTVAGWMKILKNEFPDVVTVLGGSHTLTYPKETLTHKYIDIIAIGDAWETLPELIKTLDNKGDLNSVNGIGFKDKGGNIILTSPRRKVNSWDDIPFPARDLLPNDLYSTIISTQRPSTIIMTALGCPYICGYCDTPIRTVYRTPESVADEIEECVVKYGVKEINFYDETFTINQERAFKVCDEIIKRGLNKKIAFTIRTRADCITEELIKKLAEAGCTRINFGIESASEELLKKMKRYLSLDTIKRAIGWTKKHGIQAFGFFMIGIPGDTKESIEKTIDLAIELDLDYVQFTKLTPLPNTQVYFELQKETGTDYWRDYTLGKITGNETLQVTSCTIPPKELDELLQHAYKKFYFRPRYVLRRLKMVRSFTEFKDLFLSAIAVAGVNEFF